MPMFAVSFRSLLCLWPSSRGLRRLTYLYDYDER